MSQYHSSLGLANISRCKNNRSTLVCSTGGRINPSLSRSGRVTFELYIISWSTRLATSTIYKASFRQLLVRSRLETSILLFLLCDTCVSLSAVSRYRQAMSQIVRRYLPSNKPLPWLQLHFQYTAPAALSSSSSVYLSHTVFRLVILASQPFHRFVLVTVVSSFTLFRRWRLLFPVSSCFDSSLCC